jgi:DNA cross-link repair 1A protein
MLNLGSFMQAVLPDEKREPQIPRPVIDDVSPVIGWLRSLGLERYEDVFVREEIDWDTLHWLTEEVCFIINCIQYSLYCCLFS